MSEKFKKAYSDITERLCQMTKEERLEWFANDPSLNIRFMKEIDGTTYRISFVQRRQFVNVIGNIFVSRH